MFDLLKFAGCFVICLSVVKGVSLNEILKQRKNYNYGAGQEDDFQKLFYERLERLYQEIQIDIENGKSMKVDEKLWSGLDESHKPDVIFLDSYKGPQGILESLSVTNMSHSSHAQAEAIYFKMVESIHVLCRKMKRFGNEGDGGWDLCISPPYDLGPDCLVYSFGINFDFSFDDSLGNYQNCTVKSFDPSMSDKDHVRSKNVHFYQVGLGPLNTVTNDGWVIKNLKTIRRFLEHSERSIDVLKIDIEFSEWDSLVAMIRDKSLLSVKQLIFETHTHDLFRSSFPNPAESYRNLFDILAMLETETPFRKYHCHPNADGNFISEFTGNLLTCCYELYYINIDFLKQSQR